MPRYVAFLRGVSPVNATMPGLRRAFEAAGFRAVRTVLASGNVAFDAPAAPVDTLQRKAERAMHAVLGHGFLEIVRPLDALQGMLQADPFHSFRLDPKAKRVVTFLRADGPPLALPIEVQGARVLAVVGWQVFTAYVPQPGHPVFMKLIEQHFGQEVTTRSWDTVRRCTQA